MGQLKETIGHYINAVDGWPSGFVVVQGIAILRLLIVPTATVQASECKSCHGTATCHVQMWAVGIQSKHILTLTLSCQPSQHHSTYTPGSSCIMFQTRHTSPGHVTTKSYPLFPPVHNINMLPTSHHHLQVPNAWCALMVF